MTDNTFQVPFYKNQIWWRCAIIGNAIVFGVLVFLAYLRGLVYVIFGDVILDHYVFYMFYPYLLPMFFWQMFQYVFDISACGMMGWILPILASLVLWWILLGVVLGTIIYRARLFLQKKRGDVEQSN